MRAAVKLGLRLDAANPGHVDVSVFAGRNEGPRGHSGHLVFRADEWSELVARGIDMASAAGLSGKMMLVFDVMEPRS